MNKQELKQKIEAANGNITVIDITGKTSNGMNEFIYEFKAMPGKRIRSWFNEDDKGVIQFAHQNEPLDKIIPSAVFPSKENTIYVEDCEDYCGAHKYNFKNCLGFKDGNTQYDESNQTIQFIQKNADGSMIPGLQSEQLVIALVDRHTKLNARFPSPQNEKMLTGLKMFLEACQERVQERIDRGVMGELKK